MPHVDIDVVPSGLAEQVLELERQQYVMLECNQDFIDAALPDVEELSEHLSRYPENFLGAYIASKLVGYSAVAPWRPTDDALFMDSPRDIRLAKIRSAIAGHLVPNPIGVHRLAIDTTLATVDHYHATHAMVGFVTRIADELDREVHTTIQRPGESSTLVHLRNHNFRPTDLRIVSQVDGRDIAVKYVRPRRSRTGGKTIRTTQSRLGLDPVARFA